MLSVWLSRKSTHLFGMLPEEELVLVDEIHRTISVRERKQHRLVKLASYRMYLVMIFLEEFL